MVPYIAKRGRPSASILPQLIRAGELAGDTELKCEFCGRKFPRKKSLITHIKIHTSKF